MTPSIQRPFAIAVAVWALVLCVVPDPRPLGAPDFLVAPVRAVVGCGEPAARAVATFGLQIAVAAICTALGAVAGLALRKNKITMPAFALASGGLFAWGVGTGISDDLDTATRAIARHVLDEASMVPDGDADFLRLAELAFGFAADASTGTDPVAANRAAVLARRWSPMSAPT